MRRKLRGNNVVGKRAAERSLDRNFPRTDGLGARLNERKDFAQRRQSRNSLVGGIGIHCSYDKDECRFRLISSRLVSVTEKTLNLRGLKCPLPALRTRKALGGMQPGDILMVECTDPLAGVDIPNLLNQTGDTLEGCSKEKKLLTFRIRKK